MGELTISQVVTWLFAVAGGFVTMYKAWQIISKKLHPEADLRDKVDKLAECINNDNRRLKALENDQEENKEFEGVMCRVMLAQLNHELSGNEVAKLKAARDELNEYLTKR